MFKRFKELCLNNYKLFLGLIFIFIVPPIIIGQVLRIPTGKYTIGSEGDWVGFFGNYSGGIIGGIVAYLIAAKQIRGERARSKKEHEEKQILSRTEDIYRVPFTRRTQNFPRRCVFFGTTNNDEFLRDTTGNRRFWPVDVGVQQPTKDVFSQLELEVDQIWAEAVVYWKAGEPLYLTGEVAEEAAFRAGVSFATAKRWRRELLSRIAELVGEW